MKKTFVRTLANASLMLAVVLLTTQKTQAAKDNAASSVVESIHQRFADPDVDESPSFQRHVMPLLGRLGCNGRACHGSFQGKGGFRLSLFGYDFDKDHKALTASADPRVDTKKPRQSMLFIKPTDEDEHDGGKRYDANSWEARVLINWVKNGAQNDDAKIGKLTQLEVVPNNIVFHNDKEQQQLQVIAHWDDGTHEDVTTLCRFQTNNAGVISVDETGVVTSTGAGDSHVVAFYDKGVTPVPVLRPVDRAVAKNYPDVPTSTKIDKLVVAKLKTLGVVPAGISTDAEFLRRASLDVTGSLPSPKEVQAFLADKSRNKRSAKIDELLERPGYAAWWSTKIGDITGNNSQNSGNNTFRTEDSRQWFEWVEHRLKKNMPYDELIAGIVTGNGRRDGQSFEDYCEEMGPYFQKEDRTSYAGHPTLPHYWARRNIRTKEEKALSFAYAFLGVRLQCAQCHKHPFDQWSQKDFNEFTAFFNGITYGTPAGDKQAYQEMLAEAGLKGKKGGELRKALPTMLNEGKMIPFLEVYYNPRSQVKRKRVKGKLVKSPEHPTATLLGGEKIELGAKNDPRDILMEWMRRKENPYFARAFVNRVWANYFNVGIINPPDDHNQANPPSNKPLLDWLASEFVAHDYDIKWLHKTIVSSDTYQRSWETNSTNRLDDRNFSHAIPRRLPAEVVYDIIVQATSSDQAAAVMLKEFDKRAIGPTSSNSVLRGNTGVSYALATFGKPERISNCDCERSGDPSLLQTLFLRNDQDVLGLVGSRNGWLYQVSREHKMPFTPTSTSRSSAARQKQQAIARLSATLKKYNERIKVENAKKKKNEAVLKSLRAQRTRMMEKLAKVKSGKLTYQQAFAPKADASVSSADFIEKLGDELITAAYLRTVSRLPTEGELLRTKQHLASSDNVMKGLQDVLWALVNTKEFIINH